MKSVQCTEVRVTENREPENSILPYQASLHPQISDDPGDRHVVAAAVKCGAEAIVTFNLRHFPDTALDTWNIEVQHPDEFLVHLYHLNPDLIVNILHEQAGFIGKTFAELLAVLPKHASSWNVGSSLLES